MAQTGTPRFPSSVRIETDASRFVIIGIEDRGTQTFFSGVVSLAVGLPL